MALQKCACCGQTIKAPRAAKAGDVAIHPGADASDAALYAFYKKNAPRDELTFTRRNASPALAAEIDRLLAGKPTPADARAMRERRKVELWQAEQAAGIPAIGSQRWRDANNVKTTAERQAAEREAAAAVASEIEATAPGSEAAA